MACKFQVAEVALEWWRAQIDKSPERLAKLVDHWCYVTRIEDTETKAAIHVDALANRFPWEIEA